MKSNLCVEIILELKSANDITGSVTWLIINVGNFKIDKSVEIAKQLSVEIFNSKLVI